MGIYQFAVAGSLAFCIAIATAVSAQSAADENLQERTLDAVCDIIRTDFYDAKYNGVDWDGQCAQVKPLARTLAPAAFAARMIEMTASLETSHTVYIPADNWRLAVLHDVFENVPDVQRLRQLNRGVPELRGAGYFTRTIGDKTFVDLVLSGSPAQTAGLLAGDEILDADGSAFVTVWQTADSTQPGMAKVKVRRQETEPAITIPMQVRAQRGLQWLANATAASVRIVERDGIKIGYLRGWTMLTRPEVGGPADELERVLSDGTFAEADAVVFDARGLIGGGGLDVLSAWLRPRLRTRIRTRTSPDWEDSIDVLSADAPLVVLVDQNTRSAAEIFAMLVRAKNIAPLVGARTAGAVTGGSLRALPNGAGLYVAVAILEIDGEILEGKGVMPNIAIQQPLPYTRGADPQFDAALNEAVRLVKEQKRK